MVWSRIEYAEHDSILARFWDQNAQIEIVDCGFFLSAFYFMSNNHKTLFNIMSYLLMILLTILIFSFSWNQSSVESKR